MRLASAGLTSWHWDRSDGSMAAAGGFSADEARRITTKTGLSADAHLMLESPLRELERWLEFCELIAVHAESSEWRTAVARIRERGVTAAVAVSPDQDPAGLDLPEGVAVLVMSINPGNAGELFRPETFERVRSCAARSQVGVDGGLTLRTALECRDAGATWLVSGSSLLGAEDPAEWLRSVTSA